MKGTAEGRVTPDRALVYLTIDADGGSREDAYAAAAQTATAVDGVLATHAPAIERTVTAALMVQPRTRWKRGESVRTGWRAARTSVVEVTSFERLGEMLAELAAAGATIAGPDWKVDDDNDGYREVRMAAAADARRRAEAYAAGLNVPLGAPRWLSEPGLRLTGTSTEYFAAPAQAMRALSAGPEMAEPDVIDVSPEDVIIHAAVEVSFALLDA